MAKKPRPSSKTFPPLQIAKNDPLAPELTAVQKWVDAAIVHKKKSQFYGAIQLEEIPSGLALLQANEEQSKRFVVAAMRTCGIGTDMQIPSSARETNRALLITWSPIMNMSRRADHH